MRILTVTNIYPSPYKPHYATYNRAEFRALAKLHSLSVIAPVSWTDEVALSGNRRSTATPRSKSAARRAHG